MEHHNWKLVVLLLWAVNSFAAVGSITDVKDAPPSIQRKAQTLKANKGSGIEMMDIVRTTQGKLAMTFADATKVQLSENSKMVIDEFAYDPNSKKGGKLAMKVALGTVRYASGAVAHNNPQSVAINTPTATIGVRGTDFTATVDEIGASTIILLPSCPFGWIDIAKDCKTGEISITTDVATVILNQPFQATKVENRGVAPLKPVILNLGEDSINNMLIVSPPKQLRSDGNEDRKRVLSQGALDVDFLKETGLVNILEQQEKEFFQDKLSRNLLDQNFLENILDIVNRQLAAQLDLLNRSSNKLLPDWFPLSGITVELDEPKVTLCREDGSNVQCVTTPTRQSSTIYQSQDRLEFKNRVNNGGGTTITLIQK